jgi:hypothetical protein
MEFTKELWEKYQLYGALGLFNPLCMLFYWSPIGKFKTDVTLLQWRDVLVLLLLWLLPARLLLKKRSEWV